MSDSRVELDTGALKLEELRSILEHLPADVTFADAENVLRFYTGRYRIFDRTPETIGTSMIECHSPSSRANVERLVAELRDGWRDEATFLEEKGGRPVHIRYLPVRDNGTYLGILEIAQWADEIGA
jgi:DUF438 domain-containing protein